MRLYLTGSIQDHTPQIEMPTPGVEITHLSPADSEVAWLIHDRSPDVNAALFAAPTADCDPDLVEPQFCALPDPVMRQLKTRAVRGKLDAVAADKAVWMRLAA